MDTDAKKTVLRKITYGLYVLTASAGDELAAGTANWLSQASFTPPLVMVGVKADSGVHALIERSRAFAVNILAAGQKDLASAFFRPTEVGNGDINGFAYEPGPETGAPLLTDLPGWFEARVTGAVPGGDHTVYVAEVISVGLRDAEARSLEMGSTGWFYGG